MAELYLFPDERVVIQATVYVAALACAHYYLVKPALKIHKEREKRTSGAVASAAGENNRLTELENKYQTQVSQATQEAKELRNKEILAGQAQADEILRLAQTAAKDRVESVRSSVSSQLVAENTRKSDVTQEIAKAIMGKLSQGLNAIALVGLSVGGWMGAQDRAYAAGGDFEFWSGVFWPYFQFSVYALGMWYFGKKIADRVLQSKRDSLRTQLSEAHEAVQKAEEKISEYKKRAATLEADMVQLRKQYVEEGLRQKEDMVAEAKTVREQILRDAERRAGEIVSSARESLRQEIVDGALDMVATQLQGETLSQIDSKLRSQATQVMRQLN